MAASLSRTEVPQDEARRGECRRRVLGRLPTRIFRERNAGASLPDEGHTTRLGGKEVQRRILSPDDRHREYFGEDRRSVLPSREPRDEV